MIILIGVINKQYIIPIIIGDIIDPKNSPNFIQRKFKIFKFFDENKEINNKKIDIPKKT